MHAEEDTTTTQGIQADTDYIKCPATAAAVCHALYLRALRPFGPAPLGAGLARDPPLPPPPLVLMAPPLLPPAAAPLPPLSLSMV
jgi:hypothetical protein